MMRALSIPCVLCLITGCGDQIDQAKQAAAAAQELAAAAKQMQEASEEAEKAGEAAAAEAEAQGADAKTIEMAKAMGAMQAMGQAGGGPVVNWRQLSAFLPDSLGDFAASGDLDGKTTKAGGMEVTVAKRSYKSGERNARIEISDTVFSPIMRAPFKMAAMINEDSSSGYKKGTKVDGHTAIVEWKAKAKRSQATILVGDRFLVSVNISGTTTADDAEKLAAAIGLGKLASVKPEG